jgi:hypothetical protein
MRSNVVLCGEPTWRAAMALRLRPVRSSYELACNID